VQPQTGLGFDTIEIRRARYTAGESNWNPKMSADQRPDSTPAESERPSKTALKAEDRALQDLAVALAGLPRGRLDELNLDDDLRRALDDYGRIRAHGAKKRQRKFIGGLLRSLDTAPLIETVEAERGGHRTETALLHRIERWREDLVADDAALTRWMEAHPETDVQHLRTLIRTARKAGDADSPSERHSRAWRALFRLLREHLTADAGSVE